MIGISTKDDNGGDDKSVSSVDDIEPFSSCQIYDIGEFTYVYFRHLACLLISLPFSLILWFR